MIKFLTGIFLATVILFTSGCATPVYVEPKPIITQEILLELCTGDTPVPMKISLDKNGNPGYDGKEILAVLIQWQRTYDNCAAIHDELVNTIRKLQSSEKLKIKE